MKEFLTVFLIFVNIFCFSQTENVEYTSFIQTVIDQRNNFNNIYNDSDSVEKDSIINLARDYLIESISNELFPYWYGTKWDFNGMTRTPGKGRIACGYFVTNILVDVGFDIPRIKWAQSASEVFIKKLANENIKRLVNRPISDLENYLLSTGDGLYLVGLDMHVGFIKVKGNSMDFIHSNYYRPEIGVMSEHIKTRNPLKDSKYRVIGKLMSDAMIINWINNTAYN